MFHQGYPMKIEQLRPRHFAVLIDAENVSSKFADGLFGKIAQLGDAPVRLIYGNLSGSNLKGWTSLLLDHSLERRDQIRAVKGKDSADVALVIDAMDLLHDGRINAFCLVSSDSDFTGLAARLRRDGRNVYVFGEKKTPECLRRACDRFISLETLLPKPPEMTSIAVPPPVLPNSKTPKPLNDAVSILKNAISKSESKDGWVNLAIVGNQIDVRTYGCKNLSSLIKKTGAFEIDEKNGPMRVRAKLPTNGKPPR
jgi:uncharacterized LabA/DUF88 family protein